MTPSNLDGLREDGAQVPASAAVLTLVVILAVFLLVETNTLKEPTGVGVVMAGEA